MIDPEFQWHIDRILRSIKRRRSRARWALLFAFPLLAGICPRLAYHSSGGALLGSILGALAVGALLLFLEERWSPDADVRAALAEPGEILDFFVSPDRGFAFFSRRGCFIERARGFWPYDGKRLRMTQVIYSPEHHLIQFEVKGQVARLEDEIAFHLPKSFTSERAWGLLERVFDLLPENAPSPAQAG